RIPPPRWLYGEGRKNSNGLNLADGEVLAQIAKAFARTAEVEWVAAPLVAGAKASGPTHDLKNPARLDERLGRVTDTDAATIERAFTVASAAQRAWSDSGATERGRVLRAAADRLEERMTEFVTYLVREGGRSIPDSLSEVREAIDFMRYYAAEAEKE